MPLQFVAQGPMQIPAGGTGPAWDPANTNANVTLSNSNLTMLASNTLGGGTRSVTSKSSGKWLVEFRIDVVAAGNHFNGQVGVATGAQGLTGSDIDGGAAFHASYLVDGSKLYLSGTDLGPMAAQIFVGDYLVMAVDLTNNKVWFKATGASFGGLWNSAQTGADVAANTFGINISTLTGPFYLWADCYGASVGGAGSMGLTINTGAFVNTDLPSGFVAWT